MLFAGMVAALHLAAMISSAQDAALTPAFSFKRDQAVYLIVVKVKPSRDPSLWADIAPGMPGSTAAMGVPGAPQAPPSERPTLDRTLPERTILDRPAPELNLIADPDEAVKGRIEKEFLNKKRFKLADSAAKADFVFYVKCEYVYFYRKIVPGGGGLTVVGNADGQFNETRLARLTGMAIPAGLFRMLKDEKLHLKEAVRWEGKETGLLLRRGPFEEASPELLVKEFHRDVLK